MNNFTEAPRTEVELQAIAQALMTTRGAAPSWLSSELQTPISLPPIAADPNAYRWHMKAALSMGALLLAFMASVDSIPEVYAAPQIVARPVYIVDEDALDAIALTQESVMAGDEANVLKRLGGVVRHADGRKAWTAERTDGENYVVIFREPAGSPVYAFEVNLESGLVSPTPEAVDALVLMRVHDIEEQHLVAGR
ncbi:MAG: hypothetical protein HY923_11355 [Elusimicrobia bacterium]|nr:hypothetical protein [Elusimicrobiota bacterium]